MTPDQISAAFRQARLGAQALDHYPGGQVPPDLDTAYRIQDIAIAGWPDQPGGWKVALVAPTWRQAYPAPRLAGPVFAKNWWPAGGDAAPLSLPVIENGYAAVEAEFAVRIARDIPASLRVADPAELLPYIDSVHAAVELAGTPLPTLNALGPGAIASDFGNNIGVVLGAPLDPRVLTDHAAIATQTRVNGDIVGTGGAANVPGGPLAALQFLVEHLAGRGRSLKAGEHVSTGATTGIHPVRPGDRVEVQFGDVCRLALNIVAARPAA